MEIKTGNKDSTSKFKFDKRWRCRLDADFYCSCAAYDSARASPFLWRDESS